MEVSKEELAKVKFKTETTRALRQVRPPHAGPCFFEPRCSSNALFGQAEWDAAASLASELLDEAAADTDSKADSKESKESKSS